MTRTMIRGTEGKEDYLVCARKGGYILGIKPLLMMSDSQTEFGFRLRLVKAAGDEDIKNTKADTEGMLEVFADIPWNKRSEVRFSTVLTTSISFGVQFLTKVLEEIPTKLTEMLDSLATKFADDEKFMNRKDIEAFLTEAYTEQANDVAQKYADYKAQTAGGGASPSEGSADIVPIHGGDIEDNDDIDI